MKLAIDKNVYALSNILRLTSQVFRERYHKKVYLSTKIDNRKSRKTGGQKVPDIDSELRFTTKEELALFGFYDETHISESVMGLYTDHLFAHAMEYSHKAAIIMAFVA